MMEKKSLSCLRLRTTWGSKIMPATNISSYPLTDDVDHESAAKAILSSGSSAPMMIETLGGLLCMRRLLQLRFSSTVATSTVELSLIRGPRRTVHSGSVPSLFSLLDQQDRNHPVTFAKGPISISPVLDRHQSAFVVVVEASHFLYHRSERVTLDRSFRAAPTFAGSLTRSTSS